MFLQLACYGEDLHLIVLLMAVAIELTSFTTAFSALVTQEEKSLNHWCISIELMSMSWPFQFAPVLFFVPLRTPFFFNRARCAAVDSSRAQVLHSLSASVVHSNSCALKDCRISLSASALRRSKAASTTEWTMYCGLCTI